MGLNSLWLSEHEQEESKLKRDIDYVNKKIENARDLFEEATNTSTNLEEKEEKLFLASWGYYGVISFLNDDVFYSREELRNYFHDEYYIWLEEWSKIFNVDKKIDIYKDILTDLCKWVVEMCKTEEWQKLQNGEELLTKFEGILKWLWYKDESLKSPEEKLWDQINYWANSWDLRIIYENYPSEEEEFWRENWCLLACDDYKEALEIFQKNPNLKEDTDKYFVILKRWSKILQTWKRDLKVLNEYRLYATKIYEDAINMANKGKDPNKYEDYIKLFNETISALSKKPKERFWYYTTNVSGDLYSTVANKKDFKKKESGSSNLKWVETPGDDSIEAILQRARKAMGDLNEAQKKQDGKWRLFASENAVTLAKFGDDYYEKGDKEKAFDNYKKVLGFFRENSKYKEEYIHNYFEILRRYSKIIEQEGRNPIKEFDSEIKTRYEEAKKDLEKNKENFGNRDYQKYQEAFSWVLSKFSN